MLPLRLAAVSLLAASLGMIPTPDAAAVDPPHDSAMSIECSSCHTLHSSPGGTLNVVAGNANLCMSCHVVGGPATALPFTDADQARPAPGLPAGVSSAGTSHRWDSGAAGRTEKLNTSPGEVRSAGAFTGRFAKTYTLTVTTAGDAGTARFSWTATSPGGGSGTDLPTGADVPLDEGVTVTFLDGASSPSFQVGDPWRVVVRTDLVLPTNPDMAVRLEDGKIMCSTCHDQHSQELPPFDPAAPPFDGPGTGEGRHFLRAGNSDGQLCAECHLPRYVPAAADGSHPVGVPIPGAGDYRSPTQLPLRPGGQVDCLSCHQMHFTPSADGSLARMASIMNLCTDCHTLADTATPAEHFRTLPATQWPGGQYGSTFPAVALASRQGACTNCHQPHGWPDSADPAQDYPWLLVDREENLCTTCHDGSPVVGDIRGQLTKTSSHPVGLTTGVHDPDEAAAPAARHVECEDCHNPHRARPRVSLPGPSIAPRPAAGPLAGARGVDAAGTEVTPAAFEYQVCFRCHDQRPGAAPTPRQLPSVNVRQEFGGTFPSFHPVAAVGKNPNVPSLAGGYTTASILACTSCHNNDAGPANGGTGPNGPHGSIRPRLLERRYETADNTGFSLAAYALCFKCHDWDNSLRRDQSFGEHDKHVRGANVPCNACHDPHGSSGNTKLINFDTSIVSPLRGVLQYRSTGLFRGNCTLVCHGEQHDNFSYQGRGPGG